MKKNLFALLFICFASGSLFSQDYFHAGGAGFYSIIFQSTLEDPTGLLGDQDYSYSAGSGGVFYKSTLAWDIDRHTMFGLSAYPFLGFDFSASSRGGSSGSLVFELPILAEYYIGEPDDDHCFFVGAGGAFGHATSVNSGSIFGPQLGLGGQFEVDRNLVGARLSFTYGLNGEGDDTRMAYMFGVYYTFDN